jgi:hypothetical protein
MCSCLSNAPSTQRRRVSFRRPAEKSADESSARFRQSHGSVATIADAVRWFSEFERRIKMMIRKTLAVLATVGAVGAAAVTAPAPAEARGIGPGIAFGLAAGALTAGAIAASGPYGYGYGYGPGYYYGPQAYYAPGPYAYYGGPYYHHHYYRHW